MADIFDIAEEEEDVVATPDFPTRAQDIFSIAQEADEEVEVPEIPRGEDIFAIAEEEERPRPGVGEKIFDALEVFNYVNRGIGSALKAASTDKTIGEAWKELKGTGTGRVVRDVIFGEEAGAGGALGGAIELAGDIFLDPTTYLGVGALTKAGKASKLSKGAVNVNKSTRIMKNLSRAGLAKKSETMVGKPLRMISAAKKKPEKILDVFQKMNIPVNNIDEAINIANKAQDDVRKISSVKGDISKLITKDDFGKITIGASVKGGRRRTAEAALKELGKGVTEPTEALVKIGGQKIPFTSQLLPEATLIKGEQALKNIDKLKGAISRSKLGQMFTTRFGKTAKELDMLDRAKEVESSAISFVERRGEELGRLGEKFSPDDWRRVTDLAESGVITGTDEVSNAARHMRDTFNITERELSRFAGRGFGDKTQYIKHVLSDEARDLSKKSFGRARKIHTDKQQFDFARKLIKKDKSSLTLSEIETIRKGGKVPNVSDEVAARIRAFKDLDGPMFEYSPDIILKSFKKEFGKAMGAGEFNRRVLDGFGIAQKGLDVDDLAQLQQRGYRAASIADPRGRNPLKGYLFPDEIASEIEKVAPIYNSEKMPNLFADAYDFTLKHWKALALVAPAYHVRNVVSNMSNSALASVRSLDPRNLAKSLQFQINRSIAKGIIPDSKFARLFTGSGEGVLRKFGMRIGKNSDEALDILKKEIDFGGYTGEDIMNMLDDTPLLRDEFFVKEGGGLRDVKKGKGLIGKAGETVKKVEQGNIKVGKALEDHAKINLFTTKLQEGDTPLEALQVVQKHLFDYSDFTDFENQKIAKLIPFYRWTAKNLPLSIEKAVTTPGYLASVAKGKEKIERNWGTEFDKNLLPDWMRHNVPVDITNSPFGKWAGATDDKPLVITISDYIPMLQTVGWVQSVVDPDPDNVKAIASIPYEMVNPPLRSFAESVFNKSLTKGEISRVEGEKGSGIYEMFPKRVANFLETAMPRPIGDFNRAYKASQRGDLIPALMRMATSINFSRQDEPKALFNAKIERSKKIASFKSGIKRALRRGKPGEYESISRAYRDYMTRISGYQPTDEENLAYDRKMELAKENIRRSID